MHASALCVGRGARTHTHRYKRTAPKLEAKLALQGSGFRVLGLGTHKDDAEVRGETCALVPHASGLQTRRAASCRNPPRNSALLCVCIVREILRGTKKRVRERERVCAFVCARVSDT